MISPETNVAKDILDSIESLRDTLKNGVPHGRILNLRKVMPKVGQKIVVTCPTHNAYWSKPGVRDARKVVEE